MPRRDMLSGAPSRTLLPAMNELPQERSLQERSFRSPPLWFHVSQAGKWLLSPREARKRAVIRLLDELKAALSVQKKL
jgi:hypothetical protein